MSWTDADAREAAAVFDRDIVPAADAARRAGAPVLPSGPDAAVASYLTARGRRVLTRADFGWPVVSTPDELRARLTELWAGDPVKLPLVEPLVRLARIPDAGAPPAADVPDHIYPMY
ncbi:MAG: hypothetical protein AB7I25_03780 [Vicinamibacterales bacterium]